MGILEKLNFLDTQGRYVGPPITEQERRAIENALKNKKQLGKTLEETLRTKPDEIAEEFIQYSDYMACRPQSNLKKVVATCALEPLAWGTGAPRQKRRKRMCAELHSMRFFREYGTPKVSCCWPHNHV